MAIVTLAEYKAMLQISGTADDAVIESAISKAESIISNASRYLYSSQALTEYYSGSGLTTLVLRYRPVTAIASIYVDDSGYYGSASGAFAASTLLTSGVDYALDISRANFSETGIVHRIGMVWSNYIKKYGADLVGSHLPGIGNIKVTYTAGFDGLTNAVPGDHKLLAILLARQIAKTVANAGLDFSSESFEYYSYSLKQESPGDYATIKSLMASITDVVF
jgi:hypothetical protein